MKKLILTPILMLLFVGSSLLRAGDWPEEYLGLPGDNLNLYAVMDLFRESETLEEFERRLNDPELTINNLDLDGDNYVDYIMVTDHVEGNVHYIVLSVAISAAEFQDVAVFVVEKLRDGSVRVQLIGDEALYGKNYIIEPAYDETPNPGYAGNRTRTTQTTVVTTTYYEVATWPVIRYIHRPTYVVYRSPYRWGYYPTYWVSWTPHYWHFYYGYHYGWHRHYYTYYRPWPRYRYPRYRTYYYSGFRRYSPHVVVRVRAGHHRSTYSRPQELSRGRNRHEQVYASRNATNFSRPGAPASMARNEGSSSRSQATPAASARSSSPTRSQATPAATTRSSSRARSQATPAATTRSSTPARSQAAPASSSPARSQAAPAANTRSSSPARSQAAPAATTRSSTPARSQAAPASSTRSSSASPNVRSSSSSRSQSPAARSSNTSSQRNNTGSRGSTPSGGGSRR